MSKTHRRPLRLVAFLAAAIAVVMIIRNVFADKGGSYFPEDTERP